MNGSRSFPPLADIVIDDEMAPNAKEGAVFESRLALVRSSKWTPKKKAPVWTPKLAAEIVESMRDSSQESFVIFLLDGKKSLLGIYEHSKGSEAQSGVYEMHIAKMALLTSACFVVLCHNHPSGSSLPSDADIEVTRKLSGQLIAIDVRVLEHVVVGEDRDVIIDVDEHGATSRRIGEAPLLRGEMLLTAEADQFVTRHTIEGFGRYAPWLVSAGIVRRTVKNEKFSDLIVRSPEAATRCAREAFLWLSNEGSVLPEDVVRTTVVLVLDGRNRVTAIGHSDEEDPRLLARFVVAQQLLNGGRAVLLGRLDDMAKGAAWSRKMGDSIRAMKFATLLDIVGVNPRSPWSSSDKGWT